MSTRGLTEIVVLQAGYSAAILTTSLYSALVIMALATTMLTAPMLSVIDRWYGGTGHGSDASRLAQAKASGR
jgi:Kef-type K+ transport system membrane component KefB